MNLYDQIGTHKVNLRNCLNEDGSVDLEKANKEYKNIAIEIIKNEVVKDDSLKKEYFNFFCDISGLRGRDIATFLGLDDGQISQWRRSKDKNISNLAWSHISSFFADLFVHGEVTNIAFLSNTQRRNVGS